VDRSGRQYRAERAQVTTRGLYEQARSQTPNMYANPLHGNREIPRLPTMEGIVGRVDKPKGVNR